MADPTTNYGWNLPDVAGDAGAWGGLLNTILEDIDAKLYTADGIADAALPVAGGTMTGHMETFTQAAKGASLTGGSGTKTVDLAVANYYEIGALSGAVVIDLVNVQSASGFFEAVIIRLSNAGNASSITFKYEGFTENILWQDGVDPTWTTGGLDIIVLYTPNAGASWYGAVSIQDPS
jgi:hypothetical protein